MWKGGGLGQWALVFALAPVGASAAECTKAQAMAAENEASTLKSWAAVHRSFRSYAHCDDGAIGEGYSESVTLLLANRWNTLPSLAKLVAHDPQFQKFVDRHINDTVPRERLAKIASNAQRHCPQRHLALCGQILKAAHDG